MDDAMLMRVGLKCKCCSGKIEVWFLGAQSEVTGGCLCGNEMKDDFDCDI
jgi:hypothetical protein